MLSLSQEDNAKRQRYIRIKLFTDNVRHSPTLTQTEIHSLINRARSGDLEGAMKQYKSLVSVREKA